LEQLEEGSLLGARRPEPVEEVAYFGLRDSVILPVLSRVYAMHPRSPHSNPVSMMRGSGFGFGAFGGVMACVHPRP
jgi:hypothetical protein